MFATPEAASVSSGNTLSGAIGSATSVRYTFTGTFWGGINLSAEEQGSARLAMQNFSNVANVTFIQAATGQNYTLAFSQADLEPGMLGLNLSTVIGTKINKSEVYIDTAVSGFQSGGGGHYVMLHELGHGLGLKHSGNVSENETPPFLSAALDTQDYTIMSYNHGAYSSATAPSTPMILDIAALHHMYGANHAYNAGNSTYSYNGGSLVATLWDGGGSDTISSVGYSGNATIDLREGVNSVSHIGNTHLWNAFGANIENAQTGGGSDTVTGNALANTVESNGGNDTVNGRAGNDVLFGGDGNDSVRGGNDNDFINGNMGADQVYGDAGNDTVRGGKGVDVVYGNAGDDQLFGDFDNDTVYGEAGNDLLRGGKGDDTLIGADGNDIFWGDLGNDQMQGGAGNDIFVFLTGSGVDRIADFAGAGAVVGDKILFSSQIFATTAAALAAVTYSEGNATMSLGSGSTLTLSGVSGGLTVDDFQII